ncbi:MAG: Crp/Fnr family transcriptional regulator [Proteobacteria bacterium]|nr:Crp/Fnr family transcriptional regulator [Pseudomonadota bacterium]
MVKTRNITVTAQSLAALDAFASLPEASREKIARLCHGRRYAADEHIIPQRDDGHGVYFVMSGVVKITYFAARGRQVAFRDTGPGEMFGELSALDGDLRSAEVIARSPSFLVSLTAGNFLTVLHEYPSVSNYVLRRLAKLVRLLSDRVVEMSTLGVNNRIHAELLRLARAAGSGAGVVTIERMPTHLEFASRISCNREAVCNELNRLTKIGLLKKLQRRGMQIVDVPRLELMVAEVVE